MVTSKRKDTSQGQKEKSVAPTVDQLNADKISQLAGRYWSPSTKKEPYNPKLIEDIYKNEIAGSQYSVRRVMVLEFSQYLENYLWEHYESERSLSHVMSIVIMVNEKFRERVPAWEAFKKKPLMFSQLFHQVLKLLSTPDKTNLREQTALLVFLNHCFNSMEVDLIRAEVQKLVCLPIWNCLIQSRKEAELARIPKWKKYWKVIQKKEGGESDDIKQRKHFERSFLRKIISNFCDMLHILENADPIDNEQLTYCVRFLELMIDLESSLPTRRFFNTLLDDSHLIVHCQRSKLLTLEEGRLFSQLFDMLKFYSRFEINDETGDPLSDKEMTQLHYDKITSLQRAAFLKFPDLRDFSLSNVASVDTRCGLAKHFKSLSAEKLYEVAEYLHLLPTKDGLGDDQTYDDAFLRELLISEHERRQSQLELLNEMPLYPTEEVIWNENVVPTEYYSGEGCLALPKLNLQFLTLHDYLLRNFNLFRLESTYEIRQDIEDAVRRLKPWVTEERNTIFGGWARMAQPITHFSIVEVAKPNIGEKQPSRVRADIKIHLNVRDNIKEEWQNLRKHDVCFLIAVRPAAKIGTSYHFSEPFVPQVGLTYVRGCEIEGMLDEAGRVIEDGPEPKPKLKGDTRVWRVWLDSNQYRLDMEKVANGEEDVYETFNILMRRKPKENNFKAVLETIRDLMNAECVVPDWLHDIILGYGDPGSAHYSKLPNPIATLDFNDTFLDIEHLRQSFPDSVFDYGTKDPARLLPPYKLTFTDGGSCIRVEPHTIPNRGPYPFNEPRRNTIRFTPTQVEAIRSGMQPGLTLVVGPPGTGKTDVAVQIISNIYHNFPDQRTLIVTHSNQALNQLFEKIMMLDIDERHLLRLGHGEEALETEKDFSRYGRVNYVLAKRLELLAEVQRLQESLGVHGDVAYTCETASYFFLHHILSRWEKFLSLTSLAHNSTVAVDSVNREFPFHKFFANAPQPVFRGESYDDDMDAAEGCFRYIKKIFTQLEEFQAFEMLRSGLDRSRYLLVKEAKIIAMTCTHAALKRKELVELSFEYDNILMEESAQILEIETFIPMLLQTPLDGHNRLKRWIMIGDHHQLPPVIKNMAFQKYSNMEQSLFTRFVRLTVPTVDLDGQGRARPSICRLYNWRYKKLGDLDHVTRWPEYQSANTGFCYDYQLINVNDFNGIGESEPTPYFYQNLAEAEYVVAVYMYMRLLGYPADKISILTTYNGQKHLLRDVVNARCANNPLVGKPYKVTTVDKYQGQQNDYILLSLVRTKAVGHLRDVRRLVVAMSRARLGLYVFARVTLFQNCYELAPSFNILKQRPLELHLCPSEPYPTNRPSKDLPAGTPLMINDMPEMASFVYEFYQTKLEAIQEMYSKQKWAEVGSVPVSSETQEPIHPGAGSDSEEEDEEAKDDAEEKVVVSNEDDEEVSQDEEDEATTQDTQDVDMSQDEAV